MDGPWSDYAPAPAAPKAQGPWNDYGPWHDYQKLHDRPSVVVQPQAVKPTLAPIGNESFAHKAVQGAASLVDVARRASKAAGGVVSDAVNLPLQITQDFIKAIRQGEGLSSNPASVPNAPDQAARSLSAASFATPETPRLIGDIPKPIPPRIEPPAPGVRPTVADIAKVQAPDPRAAQAGQAAIAKVAERVEQKPWDLYAKAMQDAVQTPEGKEALKAQKNIAADQGHDKVAMQGFTKQANTDLSKLAKPVPTPKTKPPTTPGYKPSSLTEHLIKKGNNFFADEFAKRNEKVTLPMDDVARAKRATSLGFRTDLTLYHGTGKSFLEFDISKAHHGEMGIFATDKPHVAQMYGGSKILPLWGKFQNPMEVDWPKVAGHSFYSGGPMKKLIAEAKANGNDTIIVKNINDLGGPQTQYVFLKPENLRAKDVAVFDPEKVNSPNLLSAAAPGAPGSTSVAKIATDKPPKGFIQKIGDDFYRNRQSREADRRETIQGAREIGKRMLQELGPAKAAELRRKFSDYNDANPYDKPTLTPEEQALYEKYAVPLNKVEADLHAEIRKLDPEDEMGLADNKDYIHHIYKGKNPQADKAFGAPTEPRLSDVGSGRLATSTGSLKNSRFYVREDAVGKREVVMLDDHGNLHLRQGGKWVPVPSKDVTPPVGPKGEKLEIALGSPVNIGGKEWTIKRASINEKEAAGAGEYHKDFFASKLDNIVRLRNVARNLASIRNIKASSEFQQFSKPPGWKNVPEGWRETKFPAFAGREMHPILAEQLDDIWGNQNTGLAAKVEAANRAIVGTLFWQPFTHGANLLAFYGQGRGFDWISIPQNVRAAKAIGSAIADVARQGEITKELLRSGSALMAPEARNHDFFRQMLKGLGHEFEKNPETFAPLWKRLGVAPAEGYKAYMREADGALRYLNDVLVVARVQEYRGKGYSLPEAIRETERELPNYRVNSRVMGSRTASQFLQNRVWSTFGPYHNNMWRIAADMTKSLLAGGKDSMGKDERLKAMGKYLALTAGALFIIPMIDYGIRKLTGNKNDELPARGPYAVPKVLKNLAYKVAPGDMDAASQKLQGATKRLAKGMGWDMSPETLKSMGWHDDQMTAAQMIQSMLSLSPLVDQGIETVSGMMPWSGKKIDSPGRALDAATSVISPVQTAKEIAGKKFNTTEEILRNSVGLTRDEHYSRSPRAKAADDRAHAIERGRNPVVRAGDKAGDTVKRWLESIGVQ